MGSRSQSRIDGSSRIEHKVKRRCGLLEVSVRLKFSKFLLFFSVATLLLVPELGPPIFAQSNLGNLTGTVTDPSNAIVSGAKITLTPAQGGEPKTTTTNQQGVYDLRGVEPGTYNLSVEVPGFAIFVRQNIVVRGGQTQKLDISLMIEVEKQEVQVSDDSAKLDVSPSSNAGAITITEKDLDAFSDDPDELEAQLTALAGPSAGPNGGQFYVDGFTVEDQLPPKNSIREIRVNQNPFSSEYDKLGYGRIEIFTKPGTNQFHGKFSADGNDLAFDTRDPFVAQEPGYHSLLLTADVSGPLSKKASFFFDLQNRNVQNSDAISAVVLDPNFNQIPFAQTVAAPASRTVLGPRIDYQLTPTNTLSVTYQFWRENQSNQGIGQFALASQGYNLHSLQHILRVNDTQVIGSRIVNETHFQTMQQAYLQTPSSLLPEINVIGAFTGGGSNQGSLNYHHHHYELDNDTSISLNKHYIKFGARLRTVVEPYLTTGDFNGTYTFASLNAYQIAQRGLAQGLMPAQIAALGGGPTQFTLTVGQPFVRIFAEDTGVYFADDWRLRSNFTLSYGLRFETQNYIGDHADLAPRLGIAWGIGRGSNRAPKMVLRAGFGIFYDRFGSTLQLQAQTLNGINQTEYIVATPGFYPSIPSLSSLAAAQAATTTYQLAPNLHSPYTLQWASSIERQVTKSTTVSLTYLNSQGVHQLLTNNINAPLPGTFNPAIPTSGIRPFPSRGNIYEYESAGIFKQNQIIANFNVRAARNATFFGFYSYNHVNSDTNGPSSFPDNPYDIAQDYGRPTFGITHRVVVGGSLTLKHGFLLSPLVNFQSGVPFNITVGQDLIGSTIFNQRPAFATSSTPAADVVSTRYGAFNIAPAAGQPLIPVDYRTGPNSFVMNLRVSKTFAFGNKTGEHSAGDTSVNTQGIQSGGGVGFRPGAANPGGGGGAANLGSRGLSNTSGSGGSSGSASKRYSLTFSASGRNIFNIVNLAPPVGNLTSPLFGRSNALIGGPYSFAGTNRRIDFQIVFNF